MTKVIKAFLAVIGLVYAAQSFAHHSFAVHFVADETITISGQVTSFRFSNPHGIVRLTVVNDDGVEEAWQAETNSPNMLRRRGWSRDSIKPGDQVTIEGYPTRDGSPYVRISVLTFTDGSELVGQRRVLTNPDE